METLRTIIVNRGYEFDDHTSLRLLGIDSLELLDMIPEIEEAFGVKTSNELLTIYMTPTQVLRTLGKE